MDSAVVTGTFLGFYSGLVFEENLLHFNPRTVWWKQVIKLAIGLGIALGFRLGLKAILPATAIFNLVRYVIIGLWLGIGAPWLFCLIHLAQVEMSESRDPAQTGWTPAA